MQPLISKKHGFDQQKLEALMANASYRQEIIDAMTRPYEGKPWHEYRLLFVTDTRTENGLEFWKANAEVLQQAEKKYGVPPEIIVATIGIETKYGKFTGEHLVLDALSTLAFSHPDRGSYFRRELEAFLLLTRDEKRDPTLIQGSYAGAMGQSQFMPSSYREYAVDFDGDGIRDLQNSSADAIGSIANYYGRHRWRRGGAITTSADVNGKGYRIYTDIDMKPTITFAELDAAGVITRRPVAAETMCTLMELNAGDQNEYWVGFHNFYVITRYNHSNLYAMAVYQLSRRISSLYHAQNQGSY